MKKAIYTKFTTPNHNTTYTNNHQSTNAKQSKNTTHHQKTINNNINNTNNAINHYLDLFKEYLIAECGLSINTVKNYLYDINHFLLNINKSTTNTTNASKNTTKNNTRITNILKITEHNILKYFNALEISKRSLARKISTLKTYYEFLFSEKIITNNPMLNIPTPKYPVKLPKPIETTHVKKIIEYAKNNLRLLSMLKLLHSTGMRITEMLSLKVKDIIYDNCKVRNDFIIHSKGNKERIVITNQNTTSTIAEYYKEIKHKKPIYLFPSYSKQGYITRQNFHKILNKLAIECNTPKFSAHQLRHTFATTLLKNGANIIIIKELLGHNNINTTKTYTAINKQDITNTLIKKHPLSLQTKKTHTPT